MSDVTDKTIAVAADAVHEVAQQTEHVEEVIRSLNGVKVGYAALGAVIGGATAGFVAWKVAYSRASVKFEELAQEEIASMREHYHEKAVALEASQKPQLDEIVREQGYSVEEPESASPPMAVQPPAKVVEAVEEEIHPSVRTEDISEPEPVAKTAPVERIHRNVFEEAQVEDHWDYHEEKKQRSPLRPYVIHVDERVEGAYDETTFTYYDDDVLCNENDEVIAGEDRDRLVGERNLDKFGHGSNDPQIVYVRNDHLQMDIEVVRSPNTYAEEVHGFDPPEIRHGDRRRGRPRFDDDSSTG